MSAKENARKAALAAAEARLKGPPAEASTSTSSAPTPPKWEKPTEKQDQETRRNFARLLDRGIVRDNGYKQSAEAVETLLKISDNILSNTDEPKFRDIKATNPSLQNKVLSVKGGHEYMIALGFRIVTQEFVKHYVLNLSLKRMHEMVIGAEVLQTHLTSLQSRASAEATSKVNHQSVESERKARALAEYEADRDVVKTRIERERLSRQYREQAASEKAQKQAEKEAEEEQRAPGGSTATTTGPAVVEREMLVKDATMDEDDEEEDDPEDEDYNAFPSGGRRLGE